MKGKQLSKLTKKNQLNLDINWQSITELETSLRKILNAQPQISITHDYLQILIKASKQIIRAIDVIRAQQKNYASIQENYDQIQAKLNNHEVIISNLEAMHLDRLKTITDQHKMAKQQYQKGKKNLIESEQQAKHQLIQIKKENNQLRFKVEVLQREKQQLLKVQESHQVQLGKLHQQQAKYKSLLQTVERKLPEPNATSTQIFQQIMCSKISPIILSYLQPQDILNLQWLSKTCQLFLTKSNKCQLEMYKSIINNKNQVIQYYHKHIDYFEKLYMKIPEQIVQLAFYRYQIIKQTVGVDVLHILNRSAMLFEGKFVEQGQDINDPKDDINSEIGQQQIQKEINKVYEYNQSARQNIEDVEHANSDFESHYHKNKQQVHTILEIDPDVVKQYLHEQHSQKVKIQKDINLMYKKIQDTAQLYSADVESIGLFLKNILKNFSKVFVLSKNLYTDSRNLQSLNSFILRELSNWNKIQIKYTSQIQDLKAQLQAQNRLKLYFSQKGLKSQQKALQQQNIKLTIQTKLNKQTQKLDKICRDKQQIQTKLEHSLKSIKSLQTQNKQIRKAYEQGRDKYRKIIEELSVVKETIIRMNIT